MFISNKKNKKIGSSLIELLISCAVFCFMAVSIFVVLHIGSVSWKTAEEKYVMEQNIRKAVSDINSNLSNTDITSFNSGKYHSDDGEIYSWMSFKLFFSNLKSQFSDNLYIDFFGSSKGEIELDDSKFFVLYYLSPMKSPDFKDSKDLHLLPKSLVKVIIPIDKNNEKKYMTRLDVKSFMKPLSLEDTNQKTSSIVADNIADFNVSFNDSNNLEKSNDDEIPNGTISYFIVAFREVERSSRVIDEVAKKKLIKEYDKAKKHKKVEKHEDDAVKKNRYSIQINQSVVPFNNGKIN